MDSEIDKLQKENRALALTLGEIRSITNAWSNKEMTTKSAMTNIMARITVTTRSLSK